LFSSAIEGIGEIPGPLGDIIPRSASFVKVSYSLDIDMTSGFEIVIGAEETADAVNDEKEATKVTYDVTACRCTLDDKVCVDESAAPLNQNQLLNVCVSPTANDIIIKSVQSFRIEQGDLFIAFVSPGNTPNALTTISGEGERTVSISSVLVSAFFINPTEVTAIGVVVLSFEGTNGTRQLSLLGRSDKRLLQLDTNEDGTGAFDVNVSLSRHDDEIISRSNMDPSSALRAGS